MRLVGARLWLTMFAASLLVWSVPAAEARPATPVETSNASTVGTAAASSAKDGVRSEQALRGTLVRGSVVSGVGKRTRVEQCWAWTYDPQVGRTTCTRSQRALLRARPVPSGKGWEVWKGGRWAWVPYEWSSRTKSLNYSHALDLENKGTWPILAQRGPMRPGEYRAFTASLAPSGSGGDGAGAAMFVEPFKTIPSISGDGRLVAYVSDQDTRRPQIRLRDVVKGTDTLVSVSMGGGPGAGASYWPRISDDGNLVAFLSTAGDLVPRDLAALEDIPDNEPTAGDGYRSLFVRDMRTGVTRSILTVSQASPLNQYAIGDPLSTRLTDLDMSADGRYLVFHPQSDQVHIAPGVVTQNGGGIYRVDLETGQVLRVDPKNIFDYQYPYAGTGPTRISATGRFVMYGMWLPTSPYAIECVLTDMETNITVNLSVNSLGQPQGEAQCWGDDVSADGKLALFNSFEALVEGDPKGGAYLRDVGAGKTTLLGGFSDHVRPNRGWRSSISGDGRFVVFMGSAETVELTGSRGAIFVWDRITDKFTAMLPITAGPGHLQEYPGYKGPSPVIPKPGLDYENLTHITGSSVVISSDGSTVAFETSGNPIGAVTWVARVGSGSIAIP